MSHLVYAGWGGDYLAVYCGYFPFQLDFSHYLGREDWGYAVMKWVKPHLRHTSLLDTVEEMAEFADETNWEFLEDSMRDIEAGNVCDLEELLT